MNLRRRGPVLPATARPARHLDAHHDADALRPVIDRTFPFEQPIEAMDLLWYRYDGDGTADQTGALGWDPGSSATIGNGFHNFVQLFAKPAEGKATHPMAQLFGVDPNGDLRWYGYRGNGEPDPSSSTGWHPNSGNVIGNGWADFQYIVGTADVLAVKPDGALHWSDTTGMEPLTTVA